MMDNCILSIIDKAGNETIININILIIADAPENSHLNWEYTLDNTNNLITLNKYRNNTDLSDVVVYGSYLIDGNLYDTRLGSKVFQHSYIEVLTFSDNLNTANLTDLSNMFSGSNMLKTINFGQNFNTSNVKNMSNMFSFMNSLESLDLSTFDTSQVEDMSDMFTENQSISITLGPNFNTSNVKNMSDMFSSCRMLESLDLSTFDTSQVEDMSGMFLNSTKLKKIMVTKNRWVTTQADIRNMFERCGVSEVTYV